MQINRSKSWLAITAFIISIATDASAGGQSHLNREIDRIESKYQSIDDLAASFVQETHVKLIGRAVRKKGKFMFKKGGRLRIEYEGKDGKHYVSDGTTLWIYVPGDPASLETYAVDDRTVPKEALSFMGGFGKLKKEFRISESNRFKGRSEGTIALHLVPRSRGAQYESLDALFGPDHILEEMIVTNTSGNVSRYTLSKIRTNTGLSDSIFAPDFWQRHP